MTRAKPPDWNRIEAQADQVLSEVFSEVDTLIGACEDRPSTARPAAMAQTASHRSNRPAELILVAGALVAAGLVGGLWFILGRPKLAPQALPAAQQSARAARVEQGVLDSYRRETDVLAARLKSAPAPVVSDPFSGPGGIAVLPSIPAFRLPRVQAATSGALAAPLRIPPAPPGFSLYPAPLLPGPRLLAPPTDDALLIPTPLTTPTSRTAISTAPVAPAPISQEPIFSGTIEHNGATATALIRIGDQFRDYTVGSPVRDGWVVAEIRADRVILKRGSQKRTLNLGGDS